MPTASSGARAALQLTPDTGPSFAIRFAWPVTPSGWREDFLFGIWHPNASLSLELEPSPGPPPVVERGRNWAVVSRGQLGSRDRGLTHRYRAPGSPDESIVAFRGYLLTPSLHSLSPSHQITQYWGRPDLAREHNGTFTTVRITREGRRIELLTDAFGISPLYVRERPDGIVLFATSPRFLRGEDAGVSPIAESVFMHRRSLCADVSLVPEVERLRPGIILRFEGGNSEEVRWFDFDSLPQGDAPLTRAGVEQVEESFQAAMARCIALMPGTTHQLPLSSGDDSRRILASLIAAGETFRALTVRILQKDNRDLDARFAAELATRFGFQHQVFEYPSPEEYAADDGVCRTLFSAEQTEHTWIMPLVRSLPSGPALLFDGLGGDAIGNTGFMVPDILAMNGDAQLGAVVRLAIPGECSRVLRPGRWAPLEAARAAVREQLRFLAPGPNRPTYAYLLLRVRRNTSAWSQHLLPPETIAVYPYLDLDYVRAAMQYDPLAKIGETLQHRCLEQHWPDYFAIPSSRRVPASIPPGDPAIQSALAVARIRRMQRDTPLPTLAGLAARLRPRTAGIMSAAMISNRVARRSGWWLEPLLTLAAASTEHRPCWGITAEERDATVMR
ncbi:MAG TPA: hypothetical protein VFS08_14400 [Gemmatimonadaceae bacterium]|nr:hypothetical protein [Gemmatimonadaceae bacterium]